MVHHQAPCALDPGVGSLDHPSFGLHNEAIGVRLDGEQIRLPPLSG